MWLMRNPPVCEGLALLSVCQEDPCLAPCICSSRCLPPLASPPLTAEGSDFVGFHKLSNFQLFNDLDGEDNRQTSSTELLPTRLQPLRDDLGSVSLWGQFFYA